MSEQGLETATLGGGCFWCLEAVFEQVEGVASVRSGYAGGHVADPSYEAVCTGTTGHAEVVQVAFDPTTISYREILEIFLGIHDPTTRDRQGNDVGPQYRSVVFHHSDAQRAAAVALIEELGREGPWEDPIATEVVHSVPSIPAASETSEKVPSPLLHNNRLDPKLPTKMSGNPSLL